MHSKYGWHIQRNYYDSGTYLFGFNFNTNDEWGENERETYLCVYLFNTSFYIGKMYYTVDKY